MNKSVLRLLIAGLLLAALILAILRPPQTYFPVMTVETTESASRVTLGFLFDGRSSLEGCEMLTGRLARTTLMRCPNCQITQLTCKTALDTADRILLGETPLAIPSGRMANGVLTFQSVNPELALAACAATQTESLKSGAPVKCYPANAERPRISNPRPLNLWSAILFFASLLSAWLVGWLIIRYENLHAHFSHDHVASGPQKYHTHPTPRIGGLAVMTGLLAGGGIMLFADSINSERAFGLLLLASAPAFLGGLMEDVTKRVGVLERLLLTMLSGASAAWLLGATLNRLDIPGIDQALAWLPLAVVLTAFAVGGIANAINIIDGYNGLAGGFAVIALAAMAFVANNVGDALVFNAAFALAGAILGFLVWNWPRGKIFFGDGGAYLVGFVLAELSVLLVMHNPAVSPWFPLLLLIYPIFETFYSIYRRKVRNNLSPGQPDNQHLHQLIHDRLIAHHAHGKHYSRNSQVAKYLWGPTAVVALLGCLFPKSTAVLAACAAGFCVFYVVNYRRMAARGHRKHASSGQATSDQALK